MTKKWLPLESNPEVMSEFAQQLGLDTSQWRFHDVYGLDPELLAMVPQPVAAVLMLFPLTEESEKAQKLQEEEMKGQAQAIDEKVWFTKQTISNACGTVGVLHAIGNNLERLPIQEGSFFARFFASVAHMDPKERARFLEDPPQGAPDIEDAHAAAASSGQTRPPAEGEEVLLHFVAFVQVNDRLYELDGRKIAPVDHGPTSASTLLQDSARVVRTFMERANSINFNLIALATSG
ncbi:unnamed protein product [Pedinophyceae sp. YPF-701]|nr:unnamed protein product [Pedinophyceae sp. YPF-701]